MKTPDNPQEFDWRKRLDPPPYLYTAFQNATAGLTWVQVERAVNWVEVEQAGTWGQALPIPDTDPSETEFLKLTRWSNLQQQSVDEERKQKWERDIKGWFLRSEQMIKRKRRALKSLFEKGLRQRKTTGLKTALTAEEAVEEWRNRNISMTVSELDRLFITPKMAKPILEEIIKKWEADFDSSNQTSPPVPTTTPPVSTDEYTLTERERILIHCYKQQSPILRGQPGYQDYMTFARPGDRTSYPGDSSRKAKSLIRSIEKILPYLIDSEKKQAESEIETIEAKFRNQL